MALFHSQSQRHYDKMKYYMEKGNITLEVGNIFLVCNPSICAFLFLFVVVKMLCVCVCFFLLDIYFISIL